MSQHGPTVAAESVESTAQQLVDALELGQLSVYFQPIVSMQRSSSVVAVESFLRWHHPTRGLLCAADFLGDAIATGTINALGEFAVEAACSQVAAWIAAGDVDEDFALFLNLSYSEVCDLGRLAEAFARTTLDRQLVHVEVAEREIAAAPDAARLICEVRDDLGVKVVLDDCAVDPRSLDSVRALPVDMIKVDAQALTRRFGEQSRLETFFAIAEMRGLPVVVERVELGAQAEMLCERGCDLAQGYFFGMPTPVRVFDRRNSLDRVRRMIRDLDQPGSGSTGTDS